MRIDLFFSQRRVHLLKKNYLESDLTSKESSELSEDAGPRVGWELFLVALLVT